MAHHITTFTKGGTHTVEFAHPFLFKNHLFATEAEAHAALAALPARLLSPVLASGGFTTQMQDTDITLSAEHPAAEVDHIVRGIARQGLRPVPPKTLISLRADAEVLEAGPYCVFCLDRSESF